ncbi:MAG: hypothetical protein K2J13_03665, partial [Clostridia bacterium]|nr:hypothetical protein [Clostridia bacterium]
MKRKVVIIFVLALMLCMSFCMSGIAFADTTSQEVNQYVYEYANELVKYIDGGVIKDTIPIYDVDNNVSSCCFTIYVDEEPYMYIILDNYYREGISPVIEMGFGECIFNKDEKNINLNYIDYGVEKNNVVEFNNQEINRSDYKLNYNVNNSFNLLSGAGMKEGYFDDLSDFGGELKKVALMDGFSSFEPYRQEDILSNSIQRGEGICGATVAVNVLKFYYDTECYFDDIYGFSNGGAYNVYKRLIDYKPGTSNKYNIEGMGNIKSAIKSYVKDYYSSLSVSATQYLINNWTYIYNDINNKKLVLYQYEGLYSGTTRGHIVLAVGAASFAAGDKFIYVADSWNKNLRWLNYGYHSGIKCISR